jgi:hypothetical protein
MPASITFSAREDNGNANNPSLNLTTADAIQLTFVAETDTGGNGNLLLEQPTGGGVDTNTQVEIGGTSYSFTYELTGTLPTQKKDGAQQVPEQFQGSDVVIITVQDYPSAGETARFAFMPNESSSLAEMDAFGAGAINVQGVDAPPPATPICFLKGTLIETERGEVPVEDLKVGALVRTLDAGFRPILWVGRRKARFSKGPHKDKPILLAPGALGPSHTRKLIVSPQHRILIRSRHAKEVYGDREVLAPAKGLVGLKRIRRMNGVRKVEYVHILLDGHHVVTANGVLAESLFPGPMALESLPPEANHQIGQLLYGTERFVPARRFLTCGESKRLTKRLRGELIRTGKTGGCKQSLDVEISKWAADFAMERFET